MPSRGSARRLALERPGRPCRGPPVVRTPFRRVLVGWLAGRRHSTGSRGHRLPWAVAIGIPSPGLVVCVRLWALVAPASDSTIAGCSGTRPRAGRPPAGDSVRCVSGPGSGGQSEYARGTVLRVVFVSACLRRHRSGGRRGRGRHSRGVPVYRRAGRRGGVGLRRGVHRAVEAGGRSAPAAAWPACGRVDRGALRPRGAFELRAGCVVSRTEGSTRPGNARAIAGVDVGNRTKDADAQPHLT